MPLYLFKNNETGEVWEEFKTISERESFLTQNPHITQPPALPGYCDPVRIGVTHHDNAFNDLLKEVKRNHRGSTINPR